MVRELGIDGMSSEDSEGEIGTERVFQIKKLPWRDQEVTSWLRRLDGMPHKNNRNEVLKGILYRRKRVPSDLETIRRGPVNRLPQNLYRRDWLKAQSTRSLKRLGAKDVNLVLPKIDAFIPRTQ